MTNRNKPVNEMVELTQECGYFEEEVECEKNPEDVPDAFTLDNKELGVRGEQAARRYLEHMGYTILETNFTCFAGEADIIAAIDDTICFIEVKTRRNTNKGFPEESVTKAKRNRYEKIAACYLKDHQYIGAHVRFDVISLLVLGPHHAFLRMHTNAFGSGV